MRVLFLLSLITLGICSYGQDDSTLSYLDQNFKLCAKEKAVYGSLEIQGKDKFKHSIYILNTGVPVLLEHFIDYTYAVRDGLYIDYENGKEKSKGYYVNNIKEGLWLYWFRNNLSDSVIYEHNEEASRISFTYHNNGILSSRMANNEKDKTGELSAYTEEGQLKQYAKWINGTGDQFFYYPNGQVKTLERYKNKKLTSTEHFKPDGSKISEKEFKKEQEKIIAAYQKEMEEKNPSFPGGMIGFRSYFEKNFRTPKSVQEAVRNTLPVVIIFYLNKEGKAFNISVEETFGLELRNAVEDVFKNMPAWNMKGFTQFGPVRFTISLNRF